MKKGVVIGLSCGVGVLGIAVVNKLIYNARSIECLNQIVEDREKEIEMDDTIIDSLNHITLRNKEKNKRLEKRVERLTNYLFDMTKKYEEVKKKLEEYEPSGEASDEASDDVSTVPIPDIVKNKEKDEEGHEDEANDNGES